MAYPKRTDEEKREFIAKVLNLLDSKGETRKYSYLENTFELEKQYQLAQRYVREMGLSFNEVAKAPNSDFEIAAASEDDYIEESEDEGGFTEETEDDEDAEETEDSNFTLNSMTAEEVQEHLQNHASRSPYKRKQQNTIKQRKSQRRKELLEKHYEILDWLQCIDDRIVKGTATEARQMVNRLNDYADRLDALIKDRFYNRAVSLLKQFKEITASMDAYEVAEIKRRVEELAPQYATEEVGE